MFEVGKLYRISGDRLIWYIKDIMLYTSLGIGDVVMYLKKDTVNFRGFDMIFCLFLYEAQFIYVAYDMSFPTFHDNIKNTWFNNNFEIV